MLLVGFQISHREKELFVAALKSYLRILRHNLSLEINSEQRSEYRRSIRTVSPVLAALEASEPSFSNDDFCVLHIALTEYIEFLKESRDEPKSTAKDRERFDRFIGHAEAAMHRIEEWFSARGIDFYEYLHS